MKTPLRPLGRGSAAAVALWLVFAPGAHAANLAWNSPVGGAAGFASNWNPAQVPTAADNLRFILNSTYPVTFGSHVPESRQLLFRDGVVTLWFDAEHTTSTLMSVTPTAAGATPEVEIERGTLNVGGNLLVGDAAGTTGTLTLTGTTAVLNVLDPLAEFSVGNLGTGTLKVLDGARLFSESDVELGELFGGFGSLLVSGGSGLPFQRSSATIQTTTITHGDGKVLDGAQLDIDGWLNLGHLPNTEASFLVRGKSVEDSARLNVQYELNIGRASANAIAGGAATFTVGNYGVAEVGGNTWTYDDVPGGAGKLIVREHGRFKTGNLHVSDPSSEIESHGVIQVMNDLDLSGHALVVDDTTASPVLELYAPNHINSATAPALQVGGAGEGTLRQYHGVLYVHDENALIGDDAGSNGVVEVLNSGVLDVDSALIVGRAGTGRLSVREGSVVDVHDLALGTQQTGSGTIDVDGAGSRVDVDGTFDVAGLPAGGSNGPGSSLTLTNGAALTLDRPVLSGNLWGTGSLNVMSGSVLNLAGALVNRGGTMEVNSASVAGGAIQTVQGGRLDVVNADVNAQIVALLDTTGLIVSSGTVSLGDASSPLGFQFAGRLSVLFPSVTLQDADSAVVGSVDLGGSTLVAPPGGIHLPLDRSITGSGVIQGNIRPVGRMIGSGQNGFSFTGKVFGAGQGLRGSLLNFRPGSMFLGGGGMSGTIVADSGSLFAPTQNLTLGTAPLLSVVTLNGTVLVGPGIELELNPGDTTRVKGQIVLANGILENLAGKILLIREEGALRGNGTVIGTTRVSGQLDPGTGMRRLQLGTTRLESTAHLLFDVGAYASGARDTVTVSGIATLGGALDLKTQPGFVSSVGDSFLVLSATSRSGTFASVTVNGVSATGVIALHYTATAVWAVFLANPLDVPDAPHAQVASVLFSSVNSPTPRPSFALELPEAVEAHIELFDVAGRRVAVLHEGTLAAGRHAFAVPPSVAPGVCLARAVLRGASETQVRVARAVRIP